jgi:hypothetical protein
MIGEGERIHATLGGGAREISGRREAVKEGIMRVGVEVNQI